MLAGDSHPLQQILQEKDFNWLTDSWSDDYTFIMLTASVLVPLFAQHKHLLGSFWLSLAGLQ
jgi:hypothetical protein